MEGGLSLAAGVLSDLGVLGGDQFGVLAGVVDVAGLTALATAPGALRSGTAAHAATVRGLRAEQAALDRSIAQRGTRLRAADTDTAAGRLAAREDAAALAAMAEARGLLGRAGAGAEGMAA